MAYAYTTTLTTFIDAGGSASAASAAGAVSGARSVLMSSIAAASKALPASGASLIRRLPGEIAASEAHAASSATITSVATIVAASRAAARSAASSYALLREVAASVVQAESVARILLGYVLGDTQQPLPSYGLALTMSESVMSDGRSNRRTFPAALYDSYPFNSFAVLAGVAYGLGPDGLYALEDGDEAFTTRAHLGRRDFGSRLRKTVRQVGVARTAGEARLLISADGAVPYRYPVSPVRGEGRMERAVPGRGLLGSTHTIELRGNEDVVIEAAEVLLDVGSRR